ncbi:pyocin activator PrtN family protein [Vibrio harveyi]|uniref:pyocin activator PrtN family protein n=1 Tax=Vibrio harveyi TaxID=669 RepID=UPI00039EFF93|nr:pyocin activator PrtN family protein [Vibrio harveyi]MBY7703041.1 pyocin activator PrtN family protein [Vibrio harveyi]PNM52698.1 hypothetical protein AL540_010710 [Vibrio harveyi]UIL58058.1 pyocin activator PrtN family protein [Vibrio harveyi]SQA35850.1 Pyocin activator protein PrtN [Vibrio harveyi]
MTSLLGSPSTKSLLAAKYNYQPLIPLSEVAEEYLGLTPNTAKRKARNSELPFPVVRLGESQKLPWYVSFDHLASFIERQLCESHQDWCRMQP